ncbi:hypothetical protein JGS43_25035, partial [Streptomyces sp. P01-F02]|nr:hypothetical protein [Streptomyces poriferorum]
PTPAPEAEPEPAPAATSTTASGLTVRRRTPRAAEEAGPAAEKRPDPAAVEPGTPAVAAAWMAGSRRSRDDQNTASTDEGR